MNCKANLRNTGKEILIIGIPCLFPQVKDITKLLEYVRIKNENNLKKEEYLLTRFKVAKLRTRQILSTLQYFELIDNNCDFTDKGHALRKRSRETLNRDMRNIILEKSIFADVYRSDALDKTKKMEINQIARIIKNNSTNIKDATAIKRAKCVREIVDWCLAN
jgi:hypothetical protein